MMRVAIVALLSMASVIWGQTTRPTTMPTLAEGFRAAAEIIALRQKLEMLEAENSQLRQKLTATTAPSHGDKPEVVTGDKQAQIDAEQLPYELKGDRLGMTLEEFKNKYHRVIPNDPRPAPFCSDDRVLANRGIPQGDMDIDALLWKRAYAKLGIVHARTTFPFEERGPKPNKPTIAGCPADLFVYHFVDGKLYQITIIINHQDYTQVLEGIAAKFGKPRAKNTQTYQNAFGAKFDGDVTTWSNAVSAMTIIERAGNLERSLLTMSHKALLKTASDRLKTTLRTDDL